MTQADGAAQDAQAQKTDDGSGLEQLNDTTIELANTELDTETLPKVEGEGEGLAAPEPDEAGSDVDSEESRVVNSNLAGWIRVDDDNVIRGWARDRTDPPARKTVDIYIDDALIAVILADRLDPRLAQVGEGDGQYAFAMVVPPRFRTGRTYTVTAFISGTAFGLRSKKREFEIPRSEGVPQIEITRISADRISGRIVDGQFFKSVLLEAWLDGVRQDGLVTTEDVRRYGDLVLDFEISFDLASFAQFMSGGAVISAPGMVEAGLDLPVISEFAGVHATLGGDRRLQLHPAGLLDPAAISEIQVHVSAADEPAEESTRLSSTETELGDKIFSLPAQFSDQPLDITFSIGGSLIPSMSIHVEGPARRLVSNGSFEHWVSEGLSNWTSGVPSRIQRGYYAFPDRIIEAQRVTGDTVWIDLEAGSEAEVTILGQDLVKPPLRWSTAGMTISTMVRASQVVRLTLRLRDLDGDETVAEWPLITHQPWSWQFSNHSIDASGRSSGHIVLELIAHAAAGASIEVAGLTISNIPGFADERQLIPASATGENLVRNNDLTSWPHGLAISASRGRYETAEGWYVLNRRTAAPVRARATPREEDDGFAFSFCAEEITDYCRLEISLGDRLHQADIAHLKLEIASDVAARRLFRSSQIRLPEFLLIDRIMLLKRSTISVDEGFKIVDATVGIFARKVLVTRAARTLTLSVPIVEPVIAGEFAWEAPEVESGETEYLVVFEMRQPFAMTIRHVDVTASTPAGATSSGAHLQLEDYAIAAQARLTKGLESWVLGNSISPTVVSDAPARALQRWDWGVAAATTVEVVICVYNAVEETLACLESLTACTAIPHLVHLLDDGSDYDVERVEQFIADKPWMRMSHNAANLGYTASANRGLREAKSEWVVLLNSDTIVTPGWLEGLMECAGSDPMIAFTGPVSNAATYQSVPDLYDAKNSWKVNVLPEGWTPDRMAQLVGSVSRREFPETPLLNGFCTLIKRAVFMEVGGLNEGAFPAGYGEENDLCTRAVKAGYKLAVADHVYIYHSKSASFGSARRTELAKAGGKALAALHPDVNYGSLGTQFRDLPALVSLRNGVKQFLQNQVEGGS